MGKFFLSFGIAFAVLLVLFFPIFLNTDLYYQIRSNKLGFCISLYGKIKLSGGYISTYYGGLAIHLSEKKALLTGYKEMEEQRKKFSFRDFFTLKNISVHIRTGAEYFLALYALHMASGLFTFFSPAYRKIVHSNFCLENGDELRLSARIIVKSTLFQQLMGFIKYTVRRIMSAWKMKNSTT